MKKVVAPIGDGIQPPAPPPESASATAPAESSVSSGLVRQEPSPGPSATDRPLGNHPLFTDIRQAFLPSIIVGAGAGAAGLLAGTVSGIWRGENAFLFSTATAIQWFTLGSSYYGARQVAFKAYGGQENMTGLEKVKASGIAGGFAGAVGGLLRGPRNIIPGLIVWSLAGAGGQAVGGALTGRNFGTKYLASQWSPVTPLTDRQYEKMLEEKLLKVDAEIAIINDNIQEIRKGAK